MKYRVDHSGTEPWSTVITPRTRWLDIDFAELWRYRDLILLFVRRDFVATYKQTLLGPLWHFLKPLISTAIFAVVFGRIAGIPTDGLPPLLFYLSGLVIWNYFSTCLVRTSATFTENAAIFGKVYFPRLTVPLSIVLSALSAFLIQLTLFLLLWLGYFLRGALPAPNPWLLALPLLVLQVAALGFGLGILCASLTTRYRDLDALLNFGVQLWMFATPIVYPMSRVPEGWRWAYALNPMVPVVEAFRQAFFGGGAFRPAHLAVSLVATAVVLLAGVGLFGRVEKRFVDTV